MKHLLGAQISDKLLALPSNIRIGRKDLLRAITLQKFVIYDRKKFYDIGQQVFHPYGGGRKTRPEEISFSPLRDQSYIILLRH